MLSIFDVGVHARQYKLHVCTWLGLRYSLLRIFIEAFLPPYPELDVCYI